MAKEDADDAPILNPIAFLAPVFRLVVTIAIAIMGAYLFGMIGSMSYPGIGAIGGALLGFAFFGLLTCCAVGAYKDCLPDINAMFDASAVVPPVLSHAVFKHGKFTLIVTVHRLEGLQGMGGLLPWSAPDTYVSIECGLNPIKRTCVKSNLKYEEQFRLIIEPGTEHIVIKALDQDVFGAQLLGYLNLDIDEDVIGHGFPQEQSFKLEMGGKGDRTGGKTVIVLSFDYTDDYPRSAQQAHVRNFPTMSQRRKERLNRSKELWQSKDYGSCQHLEALTFSTDKRQTDTQQKIEQEKIIASKKKKKKDKQPDPESTHPPPENQV
jgi:hypothetical protein